MLERSFKKYRYHRFLAFSCVIVMISLLLALPVSAAASVTFINYDDYAMYSFPVGTDVVHVDCLFPSSWNRGSFEWTLNGVTTYNRYTGSSYQFDCYTYDISAWVSNPFYNNLSKSTNVGSTITTGYAISTDNLPSNTELTYGWAVEFSTNIEPGSILNNDKFYSYFRTYYINSSGQVLYVVDSEPVIDMYNMGGSIRIEFHVSESLDSVAMADPEVVAFIPSVRVRHFGPDPNAWLPVTVSVEMGSFGLQFGLSDVYYEAQQNEKMQQTLNRIESAMKEQNQILQDQNDKLDDIISGGSAGEDLMDGSDKLEDAGSGLGDDLGSIQDFEDQYMGQLDDNMDEVIAGADLTWIYPALSFVQRYLNKIVAAIPSKYRIVFTLPMFFGLFMYIVGHPVRAPRPDTSGDEVTRETFTETHILTGKNAGTVRSTRTVTTSREIGRVHNE